MRKNSGMGSVDGEGPAWLSNFANAVSLPILFPLKRMRLNMKKWMLVIGLCMVQGCLFAQYTRQEMGLKGQVATLHTTILRNCEKRGDEFIPKDSSKLEYTIWFDSEGRIDSMVTQTLMPDGQAYLSRIYYHHEGKKITGKLIEEFGEKKEYTIEVNYVSDREATETCRKTDGSDFYQFTLQLDQSGVLSGEKQVYFSDAGEIIAEEELYFERNKKGQVTAIITQRKGESETQTEKYFYNQSDKAGNPLKGYREGKERIGFITRSYTYY